MENKKKLIEEVLTGEEIAFEPIPEEKDSPLAHPVIDRIKQDVESNPSEEQSNNSGGADCAEEKENPPQCP